MGDNLRAFWMHKSGVITAPKPDLRAKENMDLLMDLLVVSAKYVNALNGRNDGDVDMEYQIHREGRGYLNLHLTGLSVVGCDPELYPLGEFLADLGTCQALSILFGDTAAPVIAAGSTYSRYPFYLSGTPRFPHGVNGFFLQRSVYFIAQFLVWPVAHGNLRGALDYARGISLGHDPKGLLGKEPLQSWLGEGVPAPKKKQALKLLGTETERILKKESRKFREDWSRFLRLGQTARSRSR